MFRLNDLILLIVVFSSMLGGIVFPSVASVFRPYPVYLMMMLLFLSFSSISMGDVRDTLRHQTPILIWLSFCKLILIPLAVYLIFKAIYPPYATAALLLTGISTGVVAPFISTLVNANVHLVLVIVVISSVLVPFTLPALVKLVLGRSVEISLVGGIQTMGAGGPGIPPSKTLPYFPGHFCPLQPGRIFRLFEFLFPESRHHP